MKRQFQLQQGKVISQVKQAQWVSSGISLEYARKDGQPRKETGEINWNRERERMKEQLLPLLKEMIKKQLKEEREYYKSRPSLAAKHYEEIFGTGLGNAFVPIVSKQILTQMENRRRWEWLRKGR